MSYFTNEDVIRVKEIDLLTYLQNYEPDNLKHVSGNVYCTVDHDSLVISNGKWCWFSQGIGGKSALDYLIKVRGMTFKDAVEKLIDSTPTMRSYTPSITSKKEFVMPQLSDSTWRVESYLKKRGIDAEIIKQCIQDGFIFETADYHNVLFVGYDKENNPRYGALRSTWSTFKGDARGSDKRFSFKLMPQEETTAVHIFESAPDLLCSVRRSELSFFSDFQRNACSDRYMLVCALSCIRLHYRRCGQSLSFRSPQRLRHRKGVYRNDTQGVQRGYRYRIYRRDIPLRYTCGNNVHRRFTASGYRIVCIRGYLPLCYKQKSLPEACFARQPSHSACGGCGGLHNST